MAIHKYLFALILLGALAVSSLLIGAANVSLADVFRGDEHAYSIYVVSRIPRLIAIMLAGAGLSVAGLIMQQIVQNRFASPSTTGTIDCALLGYVLGLIFLGGASQWVHLSVIFAFSVAGTLLFVRFLQRLQFKNAVLVPLIGIMYGNVVSALTTFIAYQHDLVQTMSSWTVANFASVLQGGYEILYLAIPACLLAYYYASQFSAASIGESFAKNIGLDYQKIVFLGVILVAVSASTVVMIVGVIPFLGLIVPNIVSLFMGDNMKKILPWTAYWGVVLVLSSDILGRLIIFPYEMPISMIISIFGGAVFIYLVLRDKAHA
ncbi:ABC transporter permease [Vibrio methylphosphonaticus]|uniref:ABC transporter permease n=1 Tax=Vibrio methylphosphonaticus TaxID=2946866 RepID=UPI00202A7078|nr:iron chelate uptake ABC transporter family permease subunit [Vibrio methylphosphonaticus]MCL9774153.1 iron chelate uptake ABC transporter family permease subunit [Vibrio methylphosphonaticus]